TIELLQVMIGFRGPALGEIGYLVVGLFVATWAISTRLWEEPELVQRGPQLSSVSVDAKRPGADELVLAVAPAEEADAEHVRPAGGEQIPDGVADDVALLGCDSQLRRAGEEEIRLRLGTQDVSSLDHDRLRPDPERVQRSVDLGTPAGRRNPIDDAEGPQLGEELHGLGQRSPFR